MSIQSSRKYYATHKEQYKEYKKRDREQNNDEWVRRHREYVKKFDSSPKGIYKVLKRNSIKRSRQFSLDQNEFLNWYKAVPRFCHYCSVKEGARRLEIDRKDNDIGYELFNMTLACADCNGVKGNILTEQEMLIVGELVMRKRYEKS